MNTASAAVALAIQTTANVAFDTYNSYVQKKHITVYIYIYVTLNKYNKYNIRQSQPIWYNKIVIFDSHCTIYIMLQLMLWLCLIKLHSYALQKLCLNENKHV